MKQEEPSYSNILELVLMLGPHPILTIFDSMLNQIPRDINSTF